MNIMRVAKTTIMAFLTLSVLCDEESNAELFLQAELGATQVDDAINLGLINRRLDGSTSAMRIAAGYQFGERISLETGFVEFGRYAGVFADNRWYASANGQDVLLTAYIPVSNRLTFEVFGRVLSWNGDIDFNEPADDISGEDAVFGFGTRYSLGDRFDLGIRLARYQLDDTELRYGSATLRLFF